MSLVGQVFSNRYRIERELARGGMAEVYLARDESLNRLVALKALFPEFAREPSFVERFRREAQAAANLNHPNIVGIYDWGQETGTYFIVMEYVEGRSLRELMRSEGPIEPGRAADITAEIASALAFAHRSGVVHRDVKPGNVLITPQGHVKVTDFGIARAGASDGLTQTGSVMGTATYFSPEQAQGLAVDGRSDVYSLGVVLYELVCGGVPFVADSPVSVAYKHVREEPIPPSQRNTDVPASLEQIIMSALAKEPEQRYQSADDMRADLLRFRRGRPLAAAPITAIVAEMPTSTVANAAVSAPPTVANPRVPVDDDNGAREPRRRRHPALFTLLTLLVLALLLGGILFWASNQGSKQATVRVPNVLNKAEDTAVREIEAQDLVAVVKPVNSTRPEGKVFAQDPKPGSDVKKDSEVTLSVSAGVGTKPVPDVTGMTVDDATRDLTEAKFQVKVDPAESSSSIAPGSVIRTTPAALGEAEVGSVVNIIPSKGVAIPNVVNLPQPDAFAELTEAGLTPKIKAEASDTVPAGSVTRTDPPFGTENIAGGSDIEMFVSTGSNKVDVPTVVGLSVSQARSTLEAANLQASPPVFRATTQQGNDGKVLEQNPPAGTQVAPQTTVVLTVGEYTPPATTPTTSKGSTTTVP